MYKFAQRLRSQHAKLQMHGQNVTSTKVTRMPLRRFGNAADLQYNAAHAHTAAAAAHRRAITKLQKSLVLRTQETRQQLLRNALIYGSKFSSSWELKWFSTTTLR